MDQYTSVLSPGPVSHVNRDPQQMTEQWHVCLVIQTPCSGPNTTPRPQTLVSSPQ